MSLGFGDFLSLVVGEGEGLAGEVRIRRLLCSVPVDMMRGSKILTFSGGPTVFL